MTLQEEAAWYEAGLSADGCGLDQWAKEAIIRYGRLLMQGMVGSEISSEILLLEAEREIDRLKKEINQAEVRAAQVAMMNTYERVKLEGKIDELRHTIKQFNRALDEKLDADCAKYAKTRKEPSRLEIAAMFMTSIMHPTGGATSTIGERIDWSIAVSDALIASVKDAK